MLKAILTVGGFTGLSRIFGLIREILLSHFLGASALTDAFFVAFKFPNFFRRLFAEGAFNAAFVPLFTRQLTAEGPQAAKETAEQVFSVLTVVLMIFVGVVIVATPWIIDILAPGFATTPERHDMAVTFIRITFPYILFISLAAQLSGILNALDRFAAAAGVPILLNVSMIGALLVVPITPEISPGVLLSIAVFVAGIIQFGWLYFCAMRAGFQMRLRIPRLTTKVREVLRLMGPGVIGAGVMNINFFVDTIIASYLPEKSLSYIYYADRLNQLPLSIFGIAVGTALLPTLSRYLRQGNLEQAKNSQSLAIEFALSVSIPAAFGLVLLAHPIINLIYGLSACDNQATAAALAMFAAGIPAYVLTKIFTASFFARQDTKTPVITGAICICANIVVSLLFMGILKHVALALATTVSAWLNVVLLYSILHRRGDYRVSVHVLKITGKVVSCCALMSLALLYAQFLPVDILWGGLVGQVVHLMGTIIIGMVVFGVSGYTTGAFNIVKLKQAMRAKGV